MAVNPIDILRPSTVGQPSESQELADLDLPRRRLRSFLSTVALVVLALYPGMLAVVRILSVLRGGPIILWLDTLIVSSLALSTLAVSCLPWTGSSRYYSLTNDPGGVVVAAHRIVDRSWLGSGSHDGWTIARAVPAAEVRQRWNSSQYLHPDGEERSSGMSPSQATRGDLASADDVSSARPRAALRDAIQEPEANRGQRDLSDSDSDVAVVAGDRSAPSGDAHAGTVEKEVQRADTWWSLSEELFGDGNKWKLLVQLNEGIEVAPGEVYRFPDPLVPGWRIRTPVVLVAEREWRYEG